MPVYLKCSPKPECEKDESKQKRIEQEEPVGSVTAKQRPYAKRGKRQEQRSESFAGPSKPVTMHSHVPGCEREPHALPAKIAETLTAPAISVEGGEVSGH